MNGRNDVEDIPWNGATSRIASVSAITVTTEEMERPPGRAVTRCQEKAKTPGFTHAENAIPIEERE